MRTASSIDRATERRTPCCIMKSLTTIKWHPEAYMGGVRNAAGIRTGTGRIALFIGKCVNACISLMSPCWVTSYNGGVYFTFSVNVEPYFLIGNTYFDIRVTDIIFS